MAVESLFKAVLLGAVALSCTAQQQAGLETPWDVRTILANLTKDAAELKPVFDSLAPQQWYEKKGAPSTYILQLQSAQQQLRDVGTANRLLQAQTENLTLALDDYFRQEALEFTTRSLEDGARKYADRATADKLAQLIARNFSNRERFRDYIRDLATSTEQNFKIADQEAQRCRAIISREPAARSKSTHK